MLFRTLSLVMLTTVISLAACTPTRSSAVEATQVTDASVAESAVTRLSVASPSGALSVELDDTDGKLHYRVTFNGTDVVQPSRLGLRFKNNFGADHNLRIRSHQRASQDQVWEQPWGERKFVRDHHNELALDLVRDDVGIQFTVRVRVFNDGVGFRYEFPDQKGFESVEIIDELTEFNLDDTAMAWSIPARKWNRYEYLYDHTPVSELDMVHTPVTFELDDGTHLSLHEAALVNYSGMSIERQRGSRLKANLAPHADGSLVKTSAPFNTPWRTLQITPDATGLMNSDLILNLNEPNKLGDTSWFTPGKYVGIWWGMHMRDRTWGRDGIHGATTEETIKFMDFAAAHGFDGVLVEGWNTGWDGDWYHNGDVFSFTQSYPDFDIEAIAAHGRQVGTRLIGHHETSGNITNYENQLDDAFDLYEKNDVRIVKTGYVADGGGIKRVDKSGIVKYEYHDGQVMVDHHLSVVKKAAAHKIAINPHEPVKATGLRRTYPNWVSREGARGMEYNAWGIPPNTPEHTAILPFTRMLSGPMDYTPGVFDLRPNERAPLREDMQRNDPRSRIETTLAKQLALYVVIYSPIQMAADLPENYLARMDAFQFIKDVPADWEDSRALQGEIGEFVVVARKDRNSSDWYLGTLTNEHARTVEVKLDFLDSGASYEAQRYVDGPAADYDSNPYDIKIDSRRVSANDTLSIYMGRSGGGAIRFVKR